jgi:hypothetical protein
MPPVPIEQVRPSYVPSGFTLRSTDYGAAWQGFYEVDEQEMLEYVNGSNFTWPLFVAAAEPHGKAEFFGTEERQGAPIDIGVHGARAVYHDGIWAAGPGPDQRAAGSVTIHWQTGICHSITARKGNRVYAVRGSTTTGVTVDELIKVTRSLPFPG